MKKNQVIKKRSYGLKKYDLVLESLGDNAVSIIMTEAIGLYKFGYQSYFNDMSDYYKEKYGENQQWQYFHYDCFLQIFRKYLENINKKYGETPISFNLDECLSEAQIDYIRTECVITEPFVNIYPRN